MKILRTASLGANCSDSYKKREYPINNLITRLIVIDIAPLTVLFYNYPLFCNYPLLKDISFNTKCLLVSCDQTVITCLRRAIFGINHPRDF